MTVSIEVVPVGKITLPNSERARAALGRALSRIAINASGQAKANATGRPGPNVVTGRLRSSIAGQVRGGSVGEMHVAVGTNVVYAPVIEMGGTISVRAHQRTITQAWGRPIKPKRITVSEHTVRRRAYPFLRPAVVSPFAQSWITRELANATEEALTT